MRREDARVAIAEVIHAYDHPSYDTCTFCVMCIGEANRLLDGLPPGGEGEHAALADGTVLRDRTARELGLACGSDEARWVPPADPDDLLARLDCGCDPDQGHTCQRGR